MVNVYFLFVTFKQGQKVPNPVSLGTFNISSWAVLSAAQPREGITSFLQLSLNHMQFWPLSGNEIC